MSAAQPPAMRHESAPVVGVGRLAGLGPSQAERRWARRIAARAEAPRVELVLLVAGPAADRRLDAHDVLAGARRAAIAKQVVALRECFDARGHLLERVGDLRAIFR